MNKERRRLIEMEYSIRERDRLSPLPTFCVPLPKFFYSSPFTSLLVLQGSKGNVEEVHLIWSMRDASLFDIFALELLTPIIRGTPGVFVHLCITGTKEFKVLEPKMIISKYNDNKEMRTSLNRDKNRSVLSEMVFENKIVKCDEENSIAYDSEPALAYSMGGYIHKNDSNGDVGDMAGISPAALIISEGIPPKNFNVNFRRADYG